MKKVGIVGIGKLGLCFALNLERKGFQIIGVDVSQDYVDSINSKTLKSDEPQVEELLYSSNNFIATTDYESLREVETVFVLVATPSLPDGSYDHSQIDRAVENMLHVFGNSYQLKRLVIGCTTMPGYCDELQKRYQETDWNFKVCYNPEFIAQGTIIQDQLNPDMVLIGAYDRKDADVIVEIYSELVDNTPTFSIMTPKEAEITKIALNCFLTTKIAYANMVGDVALASGVRPEVILGSIGADSRVGEKYLKYGYGFGGPCFPRDNRAFAIHAKEVGIDARISKATDECNGLHLDFQADFLSQKTEDIVFDSVTYKPQSTLLVESQQLALAEKLADRGKKVHIIERKQIIEQLKKKHGDKFAYTERNS